MIKLEVEKYCQECQAFSPVVAEDIRLGTYRDAFGEDAYGVHKTHNQIIRCERSAFCRKLVRYLKQELDGGDANE